MKQYKNRYGDVYTFTRDENHDILWEGEFKYCRFSFPNDYTRAYAEYCADEKPTLCLEEFQKLVHDYDDVKKEHVLGDKYVRMVDSLTNEISMIDPSGGPYISTGMPLDMFGFKNYKVKDFKRIDTGYKIITEKCPKCHLAGNTHKMGCETRKVTILLDGDQETKN